MIKLSEREKRAFQQAAPRLLKTWKISNAEACQLLDMSELEWARLQTGRGRVVLSDNQFARIGALVSTHVSLSIIFSGDSDRVGTWLRTPNTHEITKGRAALDVMIEGGLPVMLEISLWLHAEAAA